MMQVKNDSFEFGRIRDHSMTDGKNVVFDQPVTQAAVFLTGFRSNFVDGDHHFGRLHISLKASEVQQDGRTVRVEVSYGLRDKSDYDDAYSGRIEFCVVGDSQT